jgi:hypothetical protein
MVDMVGGLVLQRDYNQPGKEHQSRPFNGDKRSGRGKGREREESQARKLSKLSSEMIKIFFFFFFFHIALSEKIRK